jgi:hypothetical protein
VPPDSDPLHGTLETYTQPAGVQVDGFVRPATMAELLTLWQGGYELTSPLVAMSITGLSNVETAGTFTVLTYPSAAAGEVLVHQDFVASLRVMNTKAADAKVTLRINQAFRVQGVAVNGAVVPPASSSQHLIGNAVDLNIVDGSTVNTSAMFLAGTQTQAAKIRAARLSRTWAISPPSGALFSSRLPPMRSNAFSTMARPRPAPVAAVRAASPRKKGVVSWPQLLGRHAGAVVAHGQDHPGPARTCVTSTSATPV